ncbi:MAG: 50S ribosomal protein L23 [Candidatus Parcubacteria bacterium]|nr:50S ribosomal protein L23 [Candidatus Parcubacteria bacterium]
MGILDRFIKTKKTEKAKEVKKETPDVNTEKKQAVKAITEKTSSLKLKTEATKPVANTDKAAKTKKGESDYAFRILSKALITEKATNLVGLNKYSFKVNKSANKIEVKNAMKALYGVEPVSVNIINERGKRISYGRIKGKKSNWKKAIVTLKKGEKIEVYEGV